MIAKVVIAPFGPRNADDTEVCRQKPVRAQIIKRGNEFSLGKISGCPKDYDRTWVTRTGSRLGRIHRQRLFDWQRFNVTAKLVPHGGKHFFGKRVLFSRTKASKEGSAEYLSWSRLIDGRLNRPSSFARVLNKPSKVIKVRIFGQCHCRKVEEPRTDHAAPSPKFGNVRQIEFVPISVGQPLQRCSPQNIESFGVSLHQPILDPVMDHLYEMPGTRRSAIQKALFRGTLELFASRRGRKIALTRSKCRKDGLEPFPRFAIYSDHQTVSAFDSPNASARPRIEIMDPFFF